MLTPKRRHGAAGRSLRRSRSSRCHTSRSSGPGRCSPGRTWGSSEHPQASIRRDWVGYVTCAVGPATSHRVRLPAIVAPVTIAETLALDNVIVNLFQNDPTFVPRNHGLSGVSAIRLRVSPISDIHAPCLSVVSSDSPEIKPYRDEKGGLNGVLGYCWDGGWRWR